MAQDPYRYFRVEARELLEQLGKGVMALEKGGADTDLVARLLRFAHTLKGAARVVKQVEIAEKAHAIEDTLAPFRDAAAPVPKKSVAELLVALDDITERIAALTPTAASEPAQTGRAQAPDESIRSVRTDVAEVDDLLDGLAEARTHIGGIRRDAAVITRTRGLMDLLVDQLSAASHRNGGRAVAPSPVGESVRSIAEELRSAFALVERRLAYDAEQLERELKQVREIAERLRLVPAGVLFTSLERTARDVSETQGKRVRFEGLGGDVRLDAHVLTIIQTGLTQVVRNAVAHGIEAESDRLARGKPPEGLVIMEVSRRGRHVVFACRDDGRGFDLTKVRQAAARRGWLPSATENLDSRELVAMMLRGGISTSGDVTVAAGRGIGLDVVRDAAERLGGEVVVRTDEGAGTVFEIAVPLSLAALDAIAVEFSGRIATVPIEAVRGALRLTEADIVSSGPVRTVLHNGEAIPFAPLAGIFERKREAERVGAWSAVVVEGANGRAALGVDVVRGAETVVLRPLSELVSVESVVAGASLDMDGNPQLVLDPDGLVAYAGSTTSVERPQAKAKPTILVIDDSLTTRMLEQSILESAGYGVDLAVSGEDAFEKAARKPYSLFLVDVEMPGMDGFTFIERARADERLRRIPSILVTSRNAPEDRRRGLQVGARAYIVKGAFNQTELLTRIRELVE